MDTLRRVVRSLGVAAGLLLLSGVVMMPAMAASITYDFTGDVTNVSPLLTLQFTTSQKMSGSITANSTNTSGAYSIQDFHITIGTYTATMGTSGEVSIVGGRDFIFNASVEAPAGNSVNFLAPSFLNMEFSRDIGVRPPESGGFTFLFGPSFGPGEKLGSVLGDVTSLTAVPLPPAGILFGVGLVALLGLGAGGLRKRRMPQA